MSQARTTTAPTAPTAPTAVEIRRVTDADRDLLRRIDGTDLFDKPLREDAVARFLGSADHHLLLALEAGEPVGMVSGVELTHPDKGTEMFLYELSVLERAQRRGIGTALVEALAA